MYTQAPPPPPDPPLPFLLCVLQVKKLLQIEGVLPGGPGSRRKAGVWGGRGIEGVLLKNQGQRVSIEAICMHAILVCHSGVRGCVVHRNGEHA